MNNSKLKKIIFVVSFLIDKKTCQKVFTYQTFIEELQRQRAIPNSISIICYNKSSQKNLLF